jgi:hypothetical protein
MQFGLQAVILHIQGMHTAQYHTLHTNAGQPTMHCSWCSPAGTWCGTTCKRRAALRYASRKRTSTLSMACSVKTNTVHANIQLVSLACCYRQNQVQKALVQHNYDHSTATGWTRRSRACACCHQHAWCLEERLAAELRLLLNLT